MEINVEQGIAATNKKIQDHIPLAAQFIKENPARTSTASLQRKFSIGYYVAIKVMEALQEKGLVRKVTYGAWEAVRHEAK